MPTPWAHDAARLAAGGPAVVWGYVLTGVQGVKSRGPYRIEPDGTVVDVIGDRSS
jgi:hypothetical protein